jgi:ribonuclease Z
VELKRAQVQGAHAIERVIAHHASPEQVGRLFTAAKPRLAVYSHIVPSPTTAEDLIGPTRKTYAGPLAVGYDLMTIVIGDTVDVFPRRTMADK